MDSEPYDPHTTLALVIRMIRSFPASTDILHLDGAGCVHFVRHQPHSETAMTSTRAADIKAVIESERDVGIPNVVLDLRQIRFINSEGLELLIEWQRKVEAAKGSVIIVGAGERILHVLAVTQTADLFKSVDTFEEAAEYLRSRSGAVGT